MFVALATSSCILPIPHKRLHGPGVSGIVIDADRQTPIVGANVSSTDDDKAIAVSDAKGHFAIPPLYGWHGAAVIGPVGSSLFPSLDVSPYKRELILRAKGYQEQSMTVRARNPGNEWTEWAAIKLKRNP
jgi:hypothetical protein